MTVERARELTERIDAQLARPEVQECIIALAAIRDEELYREKPYSDFTEYCVEELNLSADFVDVISPLLDAASREMAASL